MISNKKDVWQVELRQIQRIKSSLEKYIYESQLGKSRDKSSKGVQSPQLSSSSRKSSIQYDKKSQLYKKRQNQQLTTPTRPKNNTKQNMMTKVSLKKSKLMPKGYDTNQAGKIVKVQDSNENDSQNQKPKNDPFQQILNKNKKLSWIVQNISNKKHNLYQSSYPISKSGQQMKINIYDQNKIVQKQPEPQIMDEQMMEYEKIQNFLDSGKIAQVQNTKQQTQEPQIKKQQKQPIKQVVQAKQKQVQKQTKLNKNQQPLKQNQKKDQPKQQPRKFNVRDLARLFGGKKQQKLSISTPEQKKNKNDQKLQNKVQTQVKQDKDKVTNEDKVTNKEKIERLIKKKGQSLNNHFQETKQKQNQYKQYLLRMPEKQKISTDKQSLAKDINFQILEAQKQRERIQKQQILKQKQIQRQKYSQKYKKTQKYSQINQNNQGRIVRKNNPKNFETTRTQPTAYMTSSSNRSQYNSQFNSNIQFTQEQERLLKGKYNTLSAKLDRLKQRIHQQCQSRKQIKNKNKQMNIELYQRAEATRLYHRYSPLKRFNRIIQNRESQKRKNQYKKQINFENMLRNNDSQFNKNASKSRTKSKTKQTNKSLNFRAKTQQRRNF